MEQSLSVAGGVAVMLFVIVMFIVLVAVGRQDARGARGYRTPRRLMYRPGRGWVHDVDRPPDAVFKYRPGESWQWRDCWTDRPVDE